MRQPTVLWKRLERFAVSSPGAGLSFAGRLARENAWSMAYAERVCREYKRFLYLSATTGTPMTPSDAVDQAWHLHLTYTRSYWQGLCREILGFDLHHEPTRGGQAEKQRFHEQYERTLAAYREAFGVAPPADIWPSAHVRFARTGDFVRVNRRTSWVLPRPGAGGAALLAATILPLALTACTESLADKGLLFWHKVALGAYAVYLFLKFLRWMGTGGWGGGGCGSVCGGCGGGD